MGLDEVVVEKVNSDKLGRLHSRAFPFQHDSTVYNIPARKPFVLPMPELFNIVSRSSSSHYYRFSIC